MGFYARHILPRLIEIAMRQERFTPFRQSVIGAAEGSVLEIGAGSGLNLGFYGGAVTSVMALEPSPEMRAIAAPRVAAAARPVTLLDASAEAIPLEDGTFDTVVTTWTLCTIPNAAKALTEMRRVLKPGGALLFVEHGRAPLPGVARWQDRLDGFFAAIGGGCHINRKIDDLVAGSGFRIEALEHAWMDGPRTHGYLYQGRARPA